MKTLVDTILEAVAKGCSVEICGVSGAVLVDARTSRGEFHSCRREVAWLTFDQAAIGADAVLAEAVRSATDAVLDAAAREQGQ